MLFGISREDDNWDVCVHKAVLALICTLVYRPIVNHEHPDHPIAVNSILANYVQSMGHSSFTTTYTTPSRNVNTCVTNQTFKVGLFGLFICNQKIVWIFYQTV